MSELVAGLLAIWFMCLGLAIMIRQHQRFLRWSGQTFIARPMNWVWSRWRTQILAFFAGIGATKIFPALWPLLLALFLLVLVGWLIGLSVAARKGQTQEYLEWCQNVATDWTRQMWTLHRWRMIFFAFGILVATRLSNTH